jgi:hypothetical protein
MLEQNQAVTESFRTLTRKQSHITPVCMDSLRVEVRVSQVAKQQEQPVQQPVPTISLVITPL